MGRVVISGVRSLLGFDSASFEIVEAELAFGQKGTGFCKGGTAGYWSKGQSGDEDSGIESRYVGGGEEGPLL